jgi:hypothetical protein
LTGHTLATYDDAEGDALARRKRKRPSRQQQSGAYRFLGDQPYTQPDDPLGYDGLVDRLATVVTRSRSSAPFVIGIEGPWGIGKSSVMLKLQQRLEDRGLKTVYYNAWNHEGRRDATEALLKTVLAKLDDDIIKDWARSDRVESVKRWSVALLRLPASFVAARLGVGNAVDKVWDRLEKTVEGANNFSNRFEEAMGKWSSRNPIGNDPGLLVVFVDDLDRCSDRSVVQVLTAIKLYLMVPRCIFVIGYDRMAVDELIFRRIGASEVVKGTMYLEKLVQVPFSIPQANAEAARACLEQSLQEAGVAPLFTGSEEIIINSTDGNPRKMKRFINVFLLRWLEVEAAEAEPPPGLLALLLLLNLHDRGFSLLVERDFSVLDRFADFVMISRAVDQTWSSEFLDSEAKELIAAKAYFELPEPGTPPLDRDGLRETVRAAFSPSFQAYRRDERLCDLVKALRDAAAGVPIETAERAAKVSREAKDAIQAAEQEIVQQGAVSSASQRLPTSIGEVMRGMPGAFQPDMAANVTATIQFKFTGAEAGNYVVTVADGKCTVQEGETDSATVIINSPSDVMLKIVGRELDPATAFMSGQYTFTGDMGVLMQMWSWFGWQ